MWNLKVKSIGNEYISLMSMNGQVMLILGVILLLVRHLIQIVLRRYFLVEVPKKQYSSNNLQYSYFYHLSIIILILTDLNWNTIDLFLWIFSYVCIGMLRNAIHVAKVQNSLFLNDVAYNNNLLTMLWASKIYGLSLLIFSVSYLMWVMHSFIGVPFRMVTILLFPTIMLGFDSTFLLIGSIVTQHNIHSYYNPNIGQIPQGYKLSVYDQIGGSAIRMWHYYTIIRLFLRSFIDKFQFLDCMWMLSVLNAGYIATNTFVKSISQYTSSKKLNNKIDNIFHRHNTKLGQICIVCMDELLNCRQLSSCGHLFHYKCLYLWLKTKNECPICRAPIHLH